MSDKPFRFKQFTIHQDRCAMKIGTDGVLLGAWCAVPNEGRILDIGTGTGLVALMLAQRSTCIIDAIEINDEAAKQSAENFAVSPWNERLQVCHTSMQSFNSEHQYHLIVSNPPYFESAKGIETEGRMLARHTGSLGLEELVTKASLMLKQEGSLALVLPAEEEQNLIAIAGRNNLFPNKLCRVKGNAESNVKRILVQLSHSSAPCLIAELIVETARHIYSEDYKMLCKDFYLAM